MARAALGLLAILTLSLAHPCRADTPPPVPTEFQDLYATLSTDLSAFNATLSTLWNGSRYPVLFAGNLQDANATAGPTLVSTTSYVLQLQALKATGVQAIMVHVSFPILYQPFYTYLATVPGYQNLTYDQFVSYYQQVAQAVRAAGMKLVVENDVVLSNDVQAAWAPAIGSYYATLNWTQYETARAQCAVTVAQTMQPDYMVVLEEPTTEAQQASQTEVSTVSGATSLVTQILSSVQQSGVTGVKLGAGVANWQPQYLQYIQSFVTLPLDFIDMHIYPINNLGPPANENFVTNALTIASTAKSAGKPITMTEAWMWKMRDSEWTVLTADDIRARGTFSFWEPLDSAFLQTLENLANYEQMPFLAPSTDDYFLAYVTYDSSTPNMTPAQLFSDQTTLASQAMRGAVFTSTAMSYYASLVSPPDKVPPTAPNNLTGVSGSPTTVNLSWTGSTDNVGVAGYYIFRNGVKIATTAQTTYGDNGLTGSTTYSYFVEAFDLGGNASSPTLTVNVMTRDVTPPTAPASLAPAVISTKQINLSWSPATDDVGVARYLVFQGVSATALSQAATVLSPNTSFVSYPLIASTTYYYGVEAVDTSGNISPMSAIVSATTLALPAAPTNLAGTPMSTKQINLSWLPGPSGMPIRYYQVLRGTSRSSLSQVGTTAQASYADYALSPSTRYYYAVQEVDTVGNVSPMSRKAVATTMALPSAPTNLVAAPASTKQIGLTWSLGPSGMPIAYYHVFRGNSASSLSQVASTPNSTYTDYALTPATTYYYAVQETDTGGNLSPLSAVVAATTPVN
jgi:chitodextrinase